MLWSKLIEFFALCIIVFNPLSFSTHTAANFAIPKLTTLRFFSFIILLLFILKYYFHGISDEQKRLNKIYNLPFVFLLFILLLSSILSISPTLSFFGEYQRFDGYITILNYVFVYFIFQSYIKTQKNIERFISFLLYPSIIIIIYGLFQAIRMDFLVWDTEKPDRIFSTMGHPIFLGTYLSMLFPFALFRFFISENFKQNFFYFIYLIFSYIAIIFTFARSAWVALIVEIIILFIFIARDNIIKKNIYKIILLFSSIILLTIILNAPPHAKNFSTVSSRAISTVQIQTDGSIKERLNIYETTLYIIKHYPFLGSGLETMRNIFTVYRKLDKIPLHETNVIADKAHNEFLHITATSGFLGLFAYLWIFITVFLLLLNRIKTENKIFNKYFLICCLSSFFGFLSSSFFAFGVISTYCIFYAIAGAGTANYNDNSYELKKVKFFNLKKILGLTIIIIFYIFLFLKFVIYPAKADYYYKKALILSSLDRKEKAGLMSLKLNPYEGTYLRFMGEFYWGLAFKNNRIDKHYLELSINLYQKYLAMQPFNTEAFYEFGKILQSIPTKDKKLFEKSILSYERAHLLYPEFPFYSISLVDAYFKHYKKYNEIYILDKAYNILKKLEKKYKDSPQVHWYLGKYFYYKGELKNAESYFKKAIKLDNKNSDFKVWLGNIYISDKKYNDAILQFKEALKLPCEFKAGVYNQLGIAYKKLGNLKQAKIQFKKALELEPGYKGAIYNLQEIEKKEK